MMFVHSTSSGSQTAASELYKAGPLVATCALCSEASPVTEQEAVEIFSYPCHHPYICPLCRSLFEAAEAADSQVAAETASKQEHNRKTDMNETEEIIDERHDQKREPDEASDNEHEERCGLLEGAGQDGDAKNGGHGCLQAEAAGPVLIIDAHIQLKIRLA